MEILTIGYEGRTLQKLTWLLKGNDVDVVLDVREIAWSRKPGFSRGQLRAALEREGIAYRHDPRLGSPSGVRHAYRSSGDWDSFAQAYREHLASVQDIVGEYVAELGAGRVCLLCFEGQAELCHRSIVAEEFVHEGADFGFHI